MVSAASDSHNGGDEEGVEGGEVGGRGKDTAEVEAARTEKEARMRKVGGWREPKP